LKYLQIQLSKNIIFLSIILSPIIFGHYILKFSTMTNYRMLNKMTLLLLNLLTPVIFGHLRAKCCVMNEMLQF